MCPYEAELLMRLIEEQERGREAPQWGYEPSRGASQEGAAQVVPSWAGGLRCCRRAKGRTAGTCGGQYACRWQRARCCPAGAGEAVEAAQREAGCVLGARAQAARPGLAAGTEWGRGGARRRAGGAPTVAAGRRGWRQVGEGDRMEIMDGPGSAHRGADTEHDMSYKDKKEYEC